MAARLKNPFNPLHIVGQKGQATAEDVNRVEDQIHNALDKLIQDVTAFVLATASGNSGASGPASGDLQGQYPNPEVINWHGGATQYGFTLHDLYGFGLLDNPTADNLLDGTSYQLYFGLDAQHGVELISAPGSPFADGRFPAWLTKAYYPTAATIGETLYRGDVAYDPTWTSGNVAAFNDYVFTDQQYVSSDGSLDFLSTVRIAEFNTSIFSGLQQVNFPQSGGGVTTAVRNTELWSGADFTANSVHQISGNGQMATICSEYEGGVTPAYLIGQWQRHGTPAPGDGTGIAIGNFGSTDFSRLGISGLLSYVVADANDGSFAWDFWAEDNTGTTSGLLHMEAAGSSFNTPLSVPVSLEVGGGALCTLLDIDANGTQAVSLGSVGPAGLTSPSAPSAWLRLNLGGSLYATPLYATT